jgi:hypothetical protein
MAPTNVDGQALLQMTKQNDKKSGFTIKVVTFLFNVIVTINKVCRNLQSPYTLT